MIGVNDLQIGDYVMTREKYYLTPTTGWINNGRALVLTHVNYTIKIADFHDEEYMWCIDDTCGKPTCVPATGAVFIARDVSDRAWTVPPRGRPWPFASNFKDVTSCGSS